MSEIDESRERVEERRERVRQRMAELGEAADREVEKAVKIKDAAIAVLGAVGMLVALRRVSKAAGRRRKKRRKLGGSPRRKRS